MKEAVRGTSADVKCTSDGFWVVKEKMSNARLGGELQIIGAVNT